MSFGDHAMKQFASIINGRMTDIVPEYVVSGEGVDAVLVPMADRYTPEFIASLVPYHSENSPHEPPVSPIPTTVTMRQARLALLAVGKLQSISAAIAVLPSPQKEAVEIEWEFATSVERTSLIASVLASELGFDEASLDQLFIHAASL